MEELITSDTFCDEMKIYGNFREKFFHFLMEKKINVNLTREEYKKYWNELLIIILKGG